MRKSVAVSSAFAALTVAATAVFAGIASADDRTAPASAPAATKAVAETVDVTAAETVTAPAVDDGDPALEYRQAGRVVTVRKAAAPVATVTLASAAYSANSAKFVLTVAAARPFTVDPAMFTLYDTEGWENDPEQTAPVRFGTGSGSLTLTFTGTPARPVALGWLPQDGEAGVAVWERG